MFKWLRSVSVSPPYSRSPLRVAAGVPIFKDSDRYVRNYDLIASDHLASLKEKGVNPFIQEDLWKDLEQSTLRLLRPVVTGSSRILDAGVGLGRLLAHFPDHDRYGVDVALPYLQETKSSGINVAVAQLEDLPYEDESFDVVVSTDVLEHVFDLYRATSELRRVLRPGGHLVVRVPFEEDMQVYYESRQYDFVHVRRFDRYGLRLHFERILGLEFVDEGMSEPLYRGPNLLRGKALANAQAVRDAVETVPHDVPDRDKLIQFASVDSDSIGMFMAHLAERHPDDYARIGRVLANFLEINLLFRKP